MRDGPVSYDPSILAEGCKDKYPQDHISMHCVQWAGHVLMNCFGVLPKKQRMSSILFHMNVTLTDGLILQGGEWPGVPWYPDMPETGAALHDLSWLVEIHQGLFPRV